MSVTEARIAFVHELFEGLGTITHRRMMGGLALYCDGQVFAILSRQDRLSLKAPGPLAEAMAAEGAERFQMEDGRGMTYWTLPEAALDAPEAACAWARRALDAL